MPSAEGTRPRLVAFDLDGTLWDPEMYQLRGGAPFTRDRASGEVRDAAGVAVRLIGESRRVLTQLATDPDWAGCRIAYVSRTTHPDWALDCLRAHLIRTDPANGASASLHDIAAHREVYPGGKVKHFAAIRQASGIAFEDMLFFDNERLNITDVSRLGVKSVYAPRGLTASAWADGLALFGLEDTSSSSSSASGPASSSSGSSASGRQKQRQRARQAR